MLSSRRCCLLTCLFKTIKAATTWSLVWYISNFWNRVHCFLDLGRCRESVLWPGSWKTGVRKGETIAQCWPESKAGHRARSASHGMTIVFSAPCKIFNSPCRSRHSLWYTWSLCEQIPGSEKLFFLFFFLRSFAFTLSTSGWPLYPDPQHSSGSLPSRLQNPSWKALLPVFVVRLFAFTLSTAGRPLSPDPWCSSWSLVLRIKFAPCWNACLPYWFSVHLILFCTVSSG